MSAASTADALVVQLVNTAQGLALTKAAEASRRTCRGEFSVWNGADGHWARGIPAKRAFR